MKKIFTALFIGISIILLSVFSVSADDGVSYDFSGVYNSLSDEAKQYMIDIGTDSADVNTLANLSFEAIISEIGEMTSENLRSPLQGLISITALLLICSMLSAYKNTLSSDISAALNITSTLCICCAVASPAVTLISQTGQIITYASNLMLAYVPIAAVLMAASGQAAGSVSYYGAMLAAGEGVLQLSNKVIVPFLNMFLGLSMTGGISPDIHLKGFTALISKTVKWLLGFVMAIFTAVLGIKQVITNSLDNVSGKAVKFALSSFVPVVGSALSEAYKTVLGGVSVLKSGIGIFVILAIGITFLPLLIKCLLWVFTLWIGKSAAEVLNLPQSAALLDSTASVFSILISILLCIMSVYIISTALVFMLGGGGA